MTSPFNEYWQARAWLRRRAALIGGLVGVAAGALLVVGGIVSGSDGFEGAGYLSYAVSRPVIWVLQRIWKGLLLVPIIALAPALNGLVLGWLVGIVLGFFPSIAKRRAASA